MAKITGIPSLLPARALSANSEAPEKPGVRRVQTMPMTSPVSQGSVLKARPVRASRLDVMTLPLRADARLLRPLNEVEIKITERFVHRKHLHAIGTASKRLNFAVTFRECGADSLDCLARGAAAKGHDILEKTIKLSSLERGYGAAAQDLLQRLRGAQIAGFVGHWRPDEKLAGLYAAPRAQRMTHSEVAAERALATALKPTPQGKSFYPVDPEHLERSLEVLKALPEWASCLFTGDYDTHDMIIRSGRSHPVPSDSDEEAFICNAINRAVAEVDRARPMNTPTQQVVRHGPQSNYPAHMLDKERGVPLVGAVANPSLPLALVDRGVWHLLSSQEQLEKYCADHKIGLKNSWKRAGTISFEPDGPGIVRLRRRATEPR